MYIRVYIEHSKLKFVIFFEYRLRFNAINLEVYNCICYNDVLLGLKA